METSKSLSSAYAPLANLLKKPLDSYKFVVGALLPLLVLLTLVPCSAYAATISFIDPNAPGPYTRDMAPQIKVDDPAAAGTGLGSVTVEAKDLLGVVHDSTIVKLIETSPGVFQNLELLLMTGNNRYTIGNTATVLINDSSQNGNPGAIDTISAPGSVVVSALDDNLNTLEMIDPLTLTETDVNSGIFTGMLHITSGPTSSADHNLHVLPGNIIVIQYAGASISAGIVLPPDNGVGAITAEVPGTIEVSYPGAATIVASTVLAAGELPGGGGGGLIRPGLVLDVVAAIMGGSPYVVSPPSFGGGYYHYSDGLTFTQGNTKTTFDTSKYNQELPRQVMVPGQQVNMTFKTFESYNPEAVIHMGLYIIPRGEDMLTSNSLASIVWEGGKPVEVNDPNHILSNATASSDSDGKFQYTQFAFVPTKSYDKMSFLARGWNDHLYSTDIRVHDDVDPKPTTSYEIPYWLHVYDNLHDADIAIEGAGFAKPHIFSHVSTSDQVWNQNGGTVQWFWDTKDQAVAMEAFDVNKNAVWIQSELLSKEVPQITQGPGASYAGNHLNREDTTALENAQKTEQDRVDTTLQMLGYPVYWNHSLTR